MHMHHHRHPQQNGDRTQESFPNRTAARGHVRMHQMGASGAAEHCHLQQHPHEPQRTGRPAAGATRIKHAQQRCLRHDRPGLDQVAHKDADTARERRKPATDKNQNRRRPAELRVTPTEQRCFDTPLYQQAESRTREHRQEPCRPCRAADDRGA